MVGVAEFSILAPELDLPSRRMLKVMMQKANITTAGLDFCDALEDCPTRHVLSVGKAALDTWHEFGLVQIGAHHGTTFRHWTPGMGHRVVMVLHHPSTLMQLSIVGYEAKDQMAFDLMRWRNVLGGVVRADALRQTTCGRCGGRRRDPVRRPAEHWVDELDGCGLCEDCYRGRSKITRKVKKKPNRSKAEAQIAGQLEMLPGDGARVMVSKK